MEEKEVYRAPPQEQNYHIYQGLSPTSLNCNIEEMTPTKKQASWSTPFIVLTVLLCLILTLMVITFCIILAHVSSRDSPDPACTSTSIGATTVSNDGMLNSSQWAESVSQAVIASYPNFTELNEQILQITRNSAEKLIGIVNTLSNLQDTSTSTERVVDDILLVVQELLVLHNDTTALPTSCKEIKIQQQNSPSGEYVVAEANGGAAYTTYCHMGELCGSGGGWTRLAYLNMTDATQSCPSGFRLYQSGGVRACGRPVTSSGSCVSVQFPSNGISYSQVCGRVVGYQYYTPDAVLDGHGSNHNNLNGDYVDGVSITRGSPRQHVWTLMTGTYEAIDNDPFNCPCSTGSTQQVQSFIGNHYFCESGIADTHLYQALLYTSDPLWDGQDCRTLETACCSVPGLPWFHRDYGTTTTTDYLELRVCGDEGTIVNNAYSEDAPVSLYEIYVK